MSNWLRTATTDTHAKASLTAEETHNLNLSFGQSHPFTNGTRSIEGGDLVLPSLFSVGIISRRRRKELDDCIKRLKSFC